MIQEAKTDINPGFFHTEELPGIACAPCHPTDVTSWREIYWSAFATRLQCVAGEHKFGWTDIGTYRPFYGRPCLRMFYID